MGARLRGYRKDAGFASGKAFAEATGWAESKVSRIETGKQNASEADLRIWCEKTGREVVLGDLVAPLRHINELWLEWRRQLQEGAEKRQTRSLSLYKRTKVFRIWEPNVIRGAIQTASYAEAIFEEAANLYGTPTDTEAAVAKRLERQVYLSAGNRIFTVVLGEQSLYSNHGGAGVMRGALDRLMNVMSLPRLSLGMVPRDAPLGIWIGHGFAMFDDKLVMVETYSAEMSVTAPGGIETYMKTFELHRRNAVYGRPAREMIQAAFDHFNR